MPQAAQSPTTTVSTATASRPVGAATATSRSASPAGTPARGAPATPTRTQKHEATQHRQRPGRRRRSTGPGRQNRRAQQTEGHAEARAILVGLDTGRRGSEDGSSSCPLKSDSTAALAVETNSRREPSTVPPERGEQPAAREDESGQADLRTAQTSPTPSRTPSAGSRPRRQNRPRRCAAAPSASKCQSGQNPSTGCRRPLEGRTSEGEEGTGRLGSHQRLRVSGEPGQAPGPQQPRRLALATQGRGTRAAPSGRHAWGALRRRPAVNTVDAGPRAARISGSSVTWIS